MRADVRAPTNSLTDAQIMIRLLFECRYNEMLSKELHHLVNLSSSAEVRVRMVDRPPRTSPSSLAREFIWQQQEDQRNPPHTCAKSLDCYRSVGLSIITSKLLKHCL